MTRKSNRKGKLSSRDTKSLLEVRDQLHFKQVNCIVVINDQFAGIKVNFRTVLSSSNDEEPNFALDSLKR